MSVLRTLAEHDAAGLAEFREEGRATLLVRLLHTECLLELAKLSGAGFDMASYADMAVDVMEQLLPLQGCAVSIDVPGVPPIRTARGTAHDPGAASTSFVLGGNGHGSVRLSFEEVELGPPEFVRAVAEQLSAGLTLVVESEQLRRRAAVADTARLLSALGDDPSAESLESLVEALTYLPNVIGVSLEIVHPVVDGTVLLTCGVRPSGEWISRSVDSGFIRTAVTWAGAPLEADEAVVADVVDSIALALEKAEERRRLLKEAQTDHLTGVANRRRAMQALEMALALARLNGDVLAVACFDLDRFKQVNDRYGHAAGDDVLVRFAAHLRSSVRRSDTVARIGGEEFLLICPGLDERSGQRLLQGVVDSTAAACRSELAPEWHQSVSVGLAVHPDAGTGAEELLRVADLALYSVKHTGGNAVAVAAPRD